jgi:hypothetical protein
MRAPSLSCPHCIAACALTAGFKRASSSQVRLGLCAGATAASLPAPAPRTCNDLGGRHEAGLHAMELIEGGHLG